MVVLNKVLAGSCLVTKKKDEAKDGYRSFQCAFQPKKKANKAETGLFKKFGKKGSYQYAREFRMSADDPMYDKVRGFKVWLSDMDLPAVRNHTVTKIS